MWRVQVTQGNAVHMWGQRPGVQITRFDVRTASNQPIPLAGQPGDIVLNNGDKLQLDLAVTKPAPGMSLQFFAADEQGARFPIVETLDESNSTVAINQSWVVNLPSGRYTLNLIADDFGSSLAMSSTVTLQVNDSVAPTTPANLTAQLQLDGSVRLTWTPVDAPDLAGYAIGVAGETPLAVEGQFDSYTVAGLPPGNTQTLTVQAYDSSNNVSNAATVQLTLPTFRLESVTPDATTQPTAVTTVAAAFNGPITGATLTLMNSQNQPVIGASSPITVEQDIAVVETIGVQLALPAALADGTYTAMLNAQPVNGAPVSWQWSFTVAKDDASRQIFLPIINR